MALPVRKTVGLNTRLDGVHIPLVVGAVAKWQIVEIRVELFCRGLDRQIKTDFGRRRIGCGNPAWTKTASPGVLQMFQEQVFVFCSERNRDPAHINIQPIYERSFPGNDQSMILRISWSLATSQQPLSPAGQYTTRRRNPARSAATLRQASFRNTSL